MLACLFVGLALAWFGVTPESLANWAVRSFEDVWRFFQGFFNWGGSYILLGAMVVIPIVLLRWLFRRRRA